jgi:hypothetical protein
MMKTQDFRPCQGDIYAGECSERSCTTCEHWVVLGGRCPAVAGWYLFLIPTTELAREGDGR